MNVGTLHLTNLDAKAIVVEKTDYPNVPLDSAIVDAIILSMSNQICPKVELICGAKKYTIDGYALVDQIKSSGKPL